VTDPGLLGGLMPAALAAALVMFTDTAILSRTFACRTRSEVDPDQELLALGMANAAAGLFPRWDAPLFFANADRFRRRVRGLVARAEPAIRWVVIAAEPITDVDSTAFDMLDELQREPRDAGIELAFAQMKGPVKDCVRRYGLGTERFFPTIGVAVNEYLAETGVEWRDWEDEARPPPESG
jgi:MFS superfamily sulfate permease-like transporter